MRKSVLFQDPVAETSFRELSSSRRGKQIEWKRGKLLGAGSYGQVFQCLNLATGELMAVKHWKLAFDRDGVQEKFEKIKYEIKMLHSLSHPNIVQYYQTNLSPTMDSVDVLLEYVAGDTLREILKNYNGPQEQTIQHYSIQLLRGLRYLHSKGVVHRDLKPANVLVGKEGVLKVADFGSSRQFLDSEDSLSMSMKGSPYWMAPEVVLRQGHSYSADIWAYGCLLIEMVSGSPPWSDLSDRAKEVLGFIATENCLPTMPECSVLLQDLISRCLQRDPSLRPTASDLEEHPFHAEIGEMPAEWILESIEV